LTSYSKTIEHKDKDRHVGKKVGDNMSQANNTNDLENINVSVRDIKGFNFESRVDTVLNDIGVSYLSNPLDNIKEWKSRQGKGSDFKIPLWNWEIESKFSDGKVFPSWIDRDWIPRFKNGTFKVTVHNRGMKLSTNSLERCFIHDIYLVEIGYLRYVLKAEIKARANKVLEPNSKVEVDSGEKNLEVHNSEPNSKQNKQSSEQVLESNVSKNEANGSRALEVFCENNVDVERQNFVNETLSRYPFLNKNKIKSSKECPNRKYKILVCSQKAFRPRYMCLFRVLYLKRHQKFPSYIEKYGKIYVCKNLECRGEICKTLDLTCSFLVEINKCPRMYKPPHFCLPLPKAEILPSPDLTYYLNLKQNDVMK